MAEAIISPEALQDMDDIRSYIALDNPEAAERVIRAFETSAALLVTQPDLGSASPVCAGCDLVWSRISQLSDVLP